MTRANNRSRSAWGSQFSRRDDLIYRVGWSQRYRLWVVQNIDISILCIVYTNNIYVHVRIHITRTRTYIVHGWYSRTRATSRVYYSTCMYIYMDYTCMCIRLRCKCTTTCVCMCVGTSYNVRAYIQLAVLLNCVSSSARLIKLLSSPFPTRLYAQKFNDFITEHGINKAP